MCTEGGDSGGRRGKVTTGDAGCESELPRTLCESAGSSSAEGRRPVALVEARGEVVSLGKDAAGNASVAGSARETEIADVDGGDDDVTCAALRVLDSKARVVVPPDETLNEREVALPAAAAGAGTMPIFCIYETSQLSFAISSPAFFITSSSEARDASI